MVFAGAAGGAVGNLATQGLNLATGEQDQFDALGLAVDTVVGGVTGAAGGKAARLKQAVIGPAWRKAVIHKGLLYSTKAAISKGPARQIASTVLTRVLVRGVAGGITKGLINRFGVDQTVLSTGRAFVSTADRGRQRLRAVRAYVEQNLRESKGEHLHYALYQHVLGLTGLPLPATPNNTLTDY
ncbi:MAG: hypothetical protein ACREIA_21170 [Opitutaceae bacterium]